MHLNETQAFFWDRPKSEINMMIYTPMLFFNNISTINSGNFFV